MLYVFDACELDVAQCELRHAGALVPVEPKVFKVLAHLLAHRDRVVTKEELLEHFWPGTCISESALTRCLTKARKAVYDDSVHQRVIKTVHGHGYRFVASVAVRTSAPLAAPGATSPPEPTPPASPSTPVTPDSPRPHGRVPGERKQVTVLAAGLHGVTALAQAVDAEVLYELLTRAATLMRDTVQRFEGYVIQDTGDRLLALFGAPIAQEDHVVRALHAALEMQRAFAVYTAELRRTWGIALELALGVHAGPVVTGRRDTNAAPDATAQGFTLYLAERLQGLAAGGAIAVSAAVWQQAVGVFRFVDQGPCSVPEITQPIRLYTCIGVAPGASRLAVFLHRHRSTFLGRERELDFLGTLWARARRGQGQVVVLFGEAGVGKSRLADEFQRTLPEGHTWHAHTLSYGQAMAYHAIIPLLRTLVGLTDHDTPQRQRQHLRACLAAVYPPLAAAAPLLAQLLGIPLEADDLPTMPLEEQKRRLQHACLQVMLQHAATQPLCLLIEDLHWLDPSSQELLDLLVTAVARQPMLLLGTARPGFRDTWTDHTYGHRLTVTPLSDAHMATFIHNYCQPYDASAALTALLRARTAGNPFFLEEMLRTMQDQALIVVQDNVYVVQPDAHLAMPSSVQAMLAAHLDRLPPEDKRLLQTAAVIGTEVPFALLHAIADVSEDVLHQGLAHLQATEFLYQTPGALGHAYTFMHALTHEVAYDSLLRAQRCALHTRIVETLEAPAADRLADHVELLAHHALRGEVWAKAMAYCRQAGEKAMARSAHREAVGHFEQALSALPHLPETRGTREQAIDLQLALRSALLPSGDAGRILASLREAESLAATLDDPRRLAQVSRLLAVHFSQRGAYDQAIAVAQRLARATAGKEVVPHALANQSLGTSYSAQGNYHQAIACLGQTVASLDGARRFERFGLFFLPAVRARALLAVCHAELGTFAEGRALGEEGLQIAEAGAHPASLMFAYRGIGLLAFRQGHLPRALPLLERAMGLCQEADLPAVFPLMAATLAAAYTLTGRVADAVPLLTQAMERTNAMENLIVDFQASCPLFLGEAQVFAGRLEEAHTLAEQALALARAHQERGYEAYALRLLGEIAPRREPLESALAEAHYRQALTLAEELGMRPLQAHCHRGFGTLYATMGRREQARAALGTAIALYRDMDMAFWLPQTEAALTRLA